MSLEAALAVVGVTLLAAGILSRAIERALFSTVLVAMVAGVVLGPELAGVIEPGSDPREVRKLMEELAAVTLAIALMSTGLQVTRRDLRENARRAGALLTVGMLAMWVISGLGAWLLLDLPFWVGFLLGAILTPTDPVVASVLVTSSMAIRLLPRGLRRTLQLEAGTNDGLALPLVLLAGALATAPVGAALGEWALDAAREVGLAVVCGLALGLVTGRLVELAMGRGDVEKSHLAGLGIALALATFALIRLVGGSGVLAVFVAALAFSGTLEHRARERLEEVQEAVSKFFVLPAFVFFGAIVPWDDWIALGVPGLLFVGWILLLRRPVAVGLALRGGHAPARERAFIAWFGPIGVAAIYYATYSERFGIERYDEVFAAATLVIFSSVVVHSLTATPGVRWFAKRPPLATARSPLRDRQG